MTALPARLDTDLRTHPPHSARLRVHSSALVGVLEVQRFALPSLILPSATRIRS
jgi:hypothetical protein